MLAVRWPSAVLVLDPHRGTDLAAVAAGCRPSRGRPVMRISSEYAYHHPMGARKLLLICLATSALTGSISGAVVASLRRGPQGERGPEGERGPQGERGPEGERGP